MSRTAVPESIREADDTNLSPSARLVALIIAENDSITQKEIVEYSGLPQRTVRDALIRLDDYIDTETYLQDARMDIYEIKG